MDRIAIMAFDLIKKIDDEFKQFTGSPHAFACMVLQKYTVRVDFLKTPFGVTVSVNYDDIIRLFEIEPLPSSIKNPEFIRKWT
jgi:hypothetical protein